MKARARLALCLALALPCGAGYAAAADRTLSGIEVTAEAVVETAPDLAELDFGVRTEAPTAAAAARENAQRMDRVLDVMRKAVGANARLTTGAYSLQPAYNAPRDGSQPRVSGYRASNVIQLRTADLPRIGELIDLAIQAGANQVQRIAFTLRDASSARREALREAAQKARADAEAIANALGVKSGAVQSVVTVDVGDFRPLAREAMMAQAAPSTPVEPGVVQVRARVVLTVAIERQVP